MNDKPKKKIFRTIIIVFLESIVIGILLFAAIGLFGFLYFYDDLKGAKDKADQLFSTCTSDTFYPGGGATFYAADGSEIITLSRDGIKSEYISYIDIPENVQNAFVAVEDRTYWDNVGFDAKAMFKVLLEYVESRGNSKRGASTITQQLSRSVFLDNSVTMDRKLTEIFLSYNLTDKFTKEEIMEFYVNNVYFANHIYGIEAAANNYFGISSKDLSLAQTAYLCAIPNRPEYYNPWKDVDAANSRKDKILSDMLECGYISENQYNNAIREKIEIKSQIENEIYITTSQDFMATYAIDCAVRELMENNGFSFEYDFETMEDYEAYIVSYQAEYDNMKSELSQHKYSIYTSLDPAIQNTAQEMLDKELEFHNLIEENGTYKFQGAMTIIDNETKRVVASIGGRKNQGENTQSLNRAFQSYRQPGSAIKPLLVYAPALMNGFDSDSIVQNISVAAANVSDADIDMLTGTKMTMRQAVEQSENGCAMFVLNKIGISTGLEFLKEQSFKKIVPTDTTIASALGGLTYGTNTTEMCGAYHSLANNGKYVEPTCIKSIINISGEELFSENEEKEVYSLEAADEMTDILRGVITRGTARGMNWARESKLPVAGKTGTTNDNKDGWFCGYSPYYTIAVWVGYDTPEELKNLWGNTYPTNIWKNTMLEITKEK